MLPWSVSWRRTWHKEFPALSHSIEVATYLLTRRPRGDALAKIAVVSARPATRAELTAHLARAGHLAASFAQVGPLARSPALFPFDVMVLDLVTPGTDPSPLTTLRQGGSQVPVIALIDPRAQGPAGAPEQPGTQMVGGADSAAQVVKAVGELTRVADTPNPGESAAPRKRRRLLAK